MYLELNEERTNYMERFIDAFTAWSDEVDGWIYSNVLLAVDCHRLVFYSSYKICAA